MGEHYLDIFMSIIITFSLRGVRLVGSDFQSVKKNKIKSIFKDVQFAKAVL